MSFYFTGWVWYILIQEKHKLFVDELSNQSKFSKVDWLIDSVDCYGIEVV